MGKEEDVLRVGRKQEHHEVGLRGREIQRRGKNESKMEMG